MSPVFEDRVSARSPAGAVKIEVVDPGRWCLKALWDFGSGPDLRNLPFRSPEWCHPDVLFMASECSKSASLYKSLQWVLMRPCVFVLKEIILDSSRLPLLSSRQYGRQALLPGPGALIWGPWHLNPTFLRDQGFCSHDVFQASRCCPWVQGPALSASSSFIAVSCSLFFLILWYNPPVRRPVVYSSWLF